MKRLLCIAALTLSTGPALAQVSIGVNVPGVYGRIDLGGFPEPELINTQPVYVQRGPGPEVAPVYLHVPPGYERNWRRHCREYNACGQPVYFVRDDWYRNTYQPRYREVHGRDHGGPRGDGPGRGNGRDDGPGRGNGRDDGPGRGNGRDDGPGRGNGHDR